MLLSTQFHWKHIWLKTIISSLCLTLLFYLFGLFSFFSSLTLALGHPMLLHIVLVFLLGLVLGAGLAVYH